MAKKNETKKVGARAKAETESKAESTAPKTVLDASAANAVEVEAVEPTPVEVEVETVEPVEATPVEVEPKTARIKIRVEPVEATPVEVEPKTARIKIRVEPVETEPSPPSAETSPKSRPARWSSETRWGSEENDSDYDPHDRVARRKRLDRVQKYVPNRCPVTGMPLDAGPRSNPSFRPVKRDRVWMCALAVEMLRTHTPEQITSEFEDAAAFLRDRA